jgi:hypothetical protein
MHAHTMLQTVSDRVREVCNSMFISSKLSSNEVTTPVIPSSHCPSSFIQKYACVIHHIICIRRTHMWSSADSAHCSRSIVEFVVARQHAHRCLVGPRMSYYSPSGNISVSQLIHLLVFYPGRFVSAYCSDS